MDIPQLRDRAIETTLSHVHPRSRANILLWPNIANFPLFCTTLNRSNIFIFLFTNLIIYIEIWQITSRIKYISELRLKLLVIWADLLFGNGRPDSIEHFLVKLFRLLWLLVSVTDAVISVVVENLQMSFICTRGARTTVESAVWIYDDTSENNTPTRSAVQRIYDVKKKKKNQRFSAIVLLFKNGAGSY
jgi:hypothetical protein